eukprot:201515-Alexandrium_andersonii.AAC.1
MLQPCCCRVPAAARLPVAPAADGDRCSSCCSSPAAATPAAARPRLSCRNSAVAAALTAAQLRRSPAAVAC